MKKKWVWVIVAVLIIVAGAVYGLALKRNSGDQANEERQNGQQEVSQGVDETPAETATSTGSGSGAQPPKRLTYGEALGLYGPTGSGYMYQFVTCNGKPGKLSMKKGTKFLLDNRDNKAHTIVVKSQTFRLGAYGFAVATAKDVGTYNITCDGGGAAEITVAP